MHLLPFSHLYNITLRHVAPRLTLSCLLVPCWLVQTQAPEEELRARPDFFPLFLYSLKENTCTSRTPEGSSQFTYQPVSARGNHEGTRNTLRTSHLSLFSPFHIILSSVSPLPRDSNLPLWSNQLLSLKGKDDVITSILFSYFIVFANMLHSPPFSPLLIWSSFLPPPFFSCSPPSLKLFHPLHVHPSQLVCFPSRL